MTPELGRKTAGSTESILIRGILVRRSEFGKGHLGETSWQLISGGATCGAIGQSGNPCGNPGIGTTDFDVLGDAELVPHCNLEHHRKIIQDVRRDLEAQGRNTVFGRNGFGRA